MHLLSVRFLNISVCDVENLIVIIRVVEMQIVWIKAYNRTSTQISSFITSVRSKHIKLP